jgi:hypothetical protein
VVRPWTACIWLQRSVGSVIYNKPGTSERLNPEAIGRDEVGIDVERIVDGTDTRLNLSFDARNFRTRS